MSVDKACTGTAQESANALEEHDAQKIEDVLEENDEEQMHSTIPATTENVQKQTLKKKKHLREVNDYPAPYDITSEPPGSAQRRIDVMEQECASLEKEIDLRERLEVVFHDEAQRQEKHELQDRLLRLYPNVDSEDFKQNRAATFRKYPLYRARRAQISFLRSYAQRDHREEVVRKHIEAARQIGGGVTDSVVIGVGTSETTFMISRKDMAETVLEEHSDGKYDSSNPSDLDTACLHLADSWDPPRGSYGLSDKDVVNVFLGTPWGSAVKAGRSNRLLDNCPSDKVY